MSEEVSAFAAYQKLKKGGKKPKKSKKLLRSMRAEETDKLEEEYKFLKKVTNSSSSSSGKRKFVMDSSDVQRESRRRKKSCDESSPNENRSSDSSDSDSRKKSKGSQSDGSRSDHEDDEGLNGDDVPLVEEAIESMLNDSDNSLVDTGVDGDNFMSTVMKMNRSQQESNDQEEAYFAQNLRSQFGLDKKAKKAAKKKVKRVENGMTVVAVDEEKVKPGKTESGSVEEGKKCLEWMIQPHKVDKFFKDFWERRPLHIKRSADAQYYKHIFSTKVFDEILRNQNVQFTKNLDVTSYSDEQRETHNPEGRAYAPVVWDFYNNGCSLRMLNPQTFHEPVWKLCASLQEYMGNFVGANMYLTPAGTQGFAPHYDDVEVFIMQLEGKKRWRIYEPRSPQETLPRFSSKNFDQSEIGKPILDVILEPGDLMYLPRGTIHQGNCLEDFHSLHITISCHQLNSYGDLLEKIVPAALKIAMEEDIEFRRGLPPNYLQHLGIAHSDQVSKQRDQLVSKVSHLMGKLFDYAPIDGAADQLGKRFMHSALPPYLCSQELTRCVVNGGEKWNAKKGRVVNRVEIDPDTEIRMIRAQCLRLVAEESSVRIYYCVENTREYQETEPQFLEVDAEVAPAIEALIKTYPEYIKVEKLPIDKLDTKMKVVQDLWEKKLLLTKYPLEAHYDD